MTARRRAAPRARRRAVTSVLAEDRSKDASSPDDDAASVSLVGSLAQAVRAPRPAAELDFGTTAVRSRPRGPRAARRSRAELDALVVPTAELPDWMLDPSLLPKRPPLSTAAT